MRQILAFRSLALALSLVGGVATAQEFRLERDLDVLRGPDGRQLQNVYWVSLPLLPDIPDGANTDAGSTNKCVGDPTGPPAGDGIINADDLICLWWTARANPATAGTFCFTQIKASECTPVTRCGTLALGSIRFNGMLSTLDPEAGYQVLVTVPPPGGYSPRNQAILAGDGDPSWNGRVIAPSPTCAAGQTTNCCGSTAPRQELLHVPFDTLYRHSDEVLCGLEGVDWVDANGDGKPDTCWDDADDDGVRDPGEQPTGLWDGRYLMTVARFVNTPEYSGPIWRHVTMALGRPRFPGTRFPLVTGESVLLRMSPNHSPTLWLPDTP